MSSRHKRHKPFLCRCGVLLLAVVLLLPSSLAPQEIRGTVRDGSSGTPLVNVLVRIDSVGSVTLTDQEGSFLFRGIRNGNYTVSFQTLGYETVALEVEVPVGSHLLVSMTPQPIELPGFEVAVPTTQRRVVQLQMQMDTRLARLPGESRVVEPKRVRLYDTVQAKDPWRLLWKELRIPWSFDLLDSGRYEVYIDDRRTWMINLIVSPNALICRVERYKAPPHPTTDQVPDQLRAYTCLFMAEVAEGRRTMRETINWGDLIAGPGGG